MARSGRDEREDVGPQLEAVAKEIQALRRDVAEMRKAGTGMSSVANAAIIGGLLSIGVVVGLGVSNRSGSAPAVTSPASPSAPSRESEGAYNSPPPAPAAATVPVPSAAPSVPAMPPAGGGSGSAQPGSDDVADAMRGLYPTATACVPETHPTITVHLTFQPDGSVGTVNVEGPVTDTARTCIERAARSARVRPFNGPPFNAEFAM